jgi:hypothetical protein
MIGDVVRVAMPTGYRVWQILSTHLGAVGEQNMAGLAPLDIRCGKAYGTPVLEMLVPMELVDLARNQIGITPVRPRPPQYTEAVDAVIYGPHGQDLDEIGWVDLALAAMDQAGVSAVIQDEVRRRIEDALAAQTKGGE